VWRWVTWLGRLTPPEEVLATILILDAASPARDLVPRAVPQQHQKAYAPARAAVLLQAYRTLVLLCLLARGLRCVPADPSPLRWFLWAAFQTVPRPIRLRDRARSPPFDIDGRGPPAA
jgi:hypothetical protein